MIAALGRLKPRIHPSAYVAPGAHVIGDVTIGPGASVWPGAVLRGDLAPIRIGKDSNVQDNAVLHVDTGVPCVVGDRVVIGHQATVHGCRVEDGALIGIGARVLNRAVVRRGALVGAGALVREDSEVPAGMLAVGLPAKALRPLTADEKKRMAKGVRHYKNLAALYRKHLG